MDFTLTGGLNLSMVILVGPVAITITRKCGPQILMLMGAAFQSGGYACASLANRIWRVYLSQGILTGLGFGFGFICLLSTATLSRWFTN